MCIHRKARASNKLSLYPLYVRRALFRALFFFRPNQDSPGLHALHPLENYFKNGCKWYEQEHTRNAPYMMPRKHGDDGDERVHLYPATHNARQQYVGVYKVNDDKRNAYL